MFVPIPVLIGAGLVVLVLLVLIARSGRRRDPLLGGQPPVYRGTNPLPLAALPGDIEPQVRALLAAGRKIEAIKLARDATHLGLRDTKDLVEALERQRP
jgi:large subunit ribosomal protein L7/L12